MVALDWVDLKNVTSGIFISSVTGCPFLEQLTNMSLACLCVSGSEQKLT